MKMLKIKSLTMRIWMTFTIMILIIICCITFLYLFAFRAFDESAKIQDLKTYHEMLIKNNNFNQPLRFDKFRNLMGSENFVVNIQEGKSEIKDVNKPVEGPQPRNNEEKTWMTGYVKGVTSEKQFKEYHNNMKFLFIISPIKSDTGQKSYFITYMPYMADNGILYQIIIFGIAFIIIGFFTAKIVASYISKPLKELENYTKRIASKDWNKSIEIKSDDEIGSLAKCMNSMQKELKHAEENEKMFLQSISHDLKTPVMVIMSHAEAIIDGVYIDSVEKTAEIIKDEAISLEKKIRQMLYLNTLDYVLENNIENQGIDLNSVLGKMVDRFEVFNFDIKLELSENNVVVFGNEEKIKISIENILDNALRYAKDKIILRLKKEDDFAILEIYNDGSNIENKSIERIFDNLYKDKTGNFGLGLAISKKIIDFYGGEIKAVNREVGVSFIIRYPIKSNQQ
ncbi:two-component system, OmpR family, sensor histidine kinase CssS [Clostridium acidisoli DSM 12555]|uniref:histidine kinase n=1 Tax=Clostridium acidisoli DSM 12555 TaxID=1121291 RepID=A0A1W1XUP3_9CLOT|nr:HAMP domain-containing sensor histidine kinase [Clostridium acidisoli]SMC27582.1 two-component system, OmpR family, sensor histidine kinase CssS [Clostridium acidisoli DSM 12555]